MSALLNGKLKYLFLVPIIILIAFALFFEHAYAEIQREILSEKLVDKEKELELIAGMTDKYVERDKDWGSYDYAADIAVLIEDIDAMPNVYAALYDENHNLLSKRLGEADSRLLNPFNSPDFVNAVGRSEAGGLTVPYDKGDGQPPIPMYCYFRWVPSDPSAGNRLLLVNGVSPESVVTKPEGWLAAGMAAQTAVTFLINMGFVVMLCSLGHVYKSREGKKWRGPQ